MKKIHQIFNHFFRSQTFDYLFRLLPLLVIVLGVLCLIPLVAIPAIPSERATLEAAFVAFLEELSSNTGEVLVNALFYATPLIIAGIAAAVAGKGGMLNAGIEGQLCLGGFVTALIAHGYAFLPNLPTWSRFIVGLILALSLPAATAAFAGWLKNKRGIHEILTTLFMNFVLIGAIAWVLSLDAVRDASGSAQTRPIADAMRWPNWFQSKLNWGFVVSVLVTFTAWGLSHRTEFGLKLQGMGSDPLVFQRLGFNLPRIRIIVLALSGAIAGLIGWQHVLGAEWKYPEGFNPGYGWLGLGVAFTAGNSEVRVTGTCLLLGVVQSLGVGLQHRIGVPPDIVTLVQALTLVVSFMCFRWSDRINPHSSI